MIVNPVNGAHCDLIAQSKNGSGKTGAFSIGSTLRVDPQIQKPQILGKEIQWFPYMGEALTRILGLKNAPPCPTTQLLPPFHKNNHRNIIS